MTEIPLGYEVLAAYALLSLAYLTWIGLAPARSVARRLLAMSTDFAVMSLMMAVCGEVATPFYPLYLWVILGNGFRFGLGYLLTAGVLGVVGFSAVAVTTEPWRDHPLLSLGLIAGLIAIPVYAATLIRKLTEAKVQANRPVGRKVIFLPLPVMTSGSHSRP